MGTDTLVVEYSELWRSQQRLVPEALVYRLSRIGDALPLEHLYPLEGGQSARRPGAQAFFGLDEALLHRTGGMLRGADRLLAIRVRSPHLLRQDEQGWVHVGPQDVIELRSISLDQVTADEDEASLWQRMCPAHCRWVQTV